MNMINKKTKIKNEHNSNKSRIDDCQLTSQEHKGSLWTMINRTMIKRNGRLSRHLKPIKTE